ncbi:unnamed protein product [Meloidogyne enterolobii]|uniref:Uncharacterized protein n=1 Tax=Meloidogyne enterolobii TaxID=390850 RepID=A0ACB1AAU6_MELEN
MVVKEKQITHTNKVYITGKTNNVTIHGNKIEIENEDRKSPQNLLKTNFVKIMLDGTQTRIGKQLKFPFKFPEVNYDDEMLATPEHTINGSTNHINIYIEDEVESLYKEPGDIYLNNEIHIKGTDVNYVVIQGN